MQRASQPSESRLSRKTTSSSFIARGGNSANRRKLTAADTLYSASNGTLPSLLLILCLTVLLTTVSIENKAWTLTSRATAIDTGEDARRANRNCPSLGAPRYQSNNTASEGRIQIRQLNDGPEFFNSSTGKVFIPRGNNYIRLARLDDPWGGHNFGHSLFDPDHYDARCVRTALSVMRAKGYNVVRVFISEISSGRKSGAGLNTRYMRNLADFLRIAKRQKIRVIVVFWRLPRTGGYQPTSPPPKTMTGVNAYFLHKPFIEAKKRYVRDFIWELKAQNAPLENVLAWDLENEAHFMEDEKPLALASGKVTTANGRTYNMADPDHRRRILEEGLVYWAEQVSNTVRKIDPASLVTISFFSPASTSGNDPRITWTQKVISDPEVGGSSLDFIDIHVYPGLIPIEEELSSFEATKSRKPIILGEMGVWMPPVTKVRRPADAIGLLRSLQTASCREPFRVVGWILYSWDTLETAIGRRDLFTAYDNGLEIADRLSPSKLYDPCVGRSLAQQN